MLRLSGIKNMYSLITLVVLTLCVSNSHAASTSIRWSKHDFSASNQTGPGHFAGYWQIGDPTEFGPLIEEVCVFCHTPHGASTDDSTGTNRLLWNRASSPPAGTSYTYKAYTTLTGTMERKIGPDTGDNRPTGISMMCMSCHDGVTSIAANMNNNNINAPTLLNPPNAEGVKVQVSIDPFQAAAFTYPGAIGNVFKGEAISGGWGANIGDAVPGAANPNGIDLSNDHPISFEWAQGKDGYFDLPQNSALRLFGTSGRRIECATCHLVHNPSIEPFLAMSNNESLMCRACHIK